MVIWIMSSVFCRVSSVFGRRRCICAGSPRSGSGCQERLCPPLLSGDADRFGGVTCLSAAAAARHGFRFHHARRDAAVLSLWLGPGEDRLPLFATHQVGVAGAVVDESNGKVLVVQDRNKTKNAWKFPAGLSDLGENIDETAAREVFEETGVRSQFRSLLSFRQQHNDPGAFRVSDMYLICRLSPLSYHINLCTQKCLRCQWFDVAELTETTETTPITSRVPRLLLYGLENGFHNIDLTVERLLLSAVPQSNTTLH